MRTVLQVQAPAKLNLALAVGPPGADGMHPVCSWMVTVDFCDELEVTRLPAGRLSRYAILWHDDAPRRSDIDWSITSDLAVRAHIALERAAGRPLPVQLKLHKRIPVGGGLGGGSSNAAAMLHAVAGLFDLDLDAATLAAIGHALGSDVPFLVHGGSAVVGGLGEEVRVHVDPPARHFVIALPEAACATGEVYRRFDARADTAFAPDRVEALAAAATLDPAAPFNDLAAPAIDVAPAVGDACARLAALAERPAHVSGSGSSVFVVCDDAVQAEHLAAAFARATGVPAVAVRSIARPVPVAAPAAL